MTTNYVDKDTLYQEICDWQDACAAATAAGTEPPQMPNTIGKAIINIAEGLGRRWNFREYSYVDEMVLEGIYVGTKAVAKFDRGNEKRNPFGFLSFVIWRGFLNKMKTEKEEQAGRMSLMLDETIAAYNTQAVDDDMDLSKSGLIETYSFNGD